jgi:hypothetical protein
MQLRYRKTALTILWVLAVVLAGALGRLSSTSNWIVLAALAAIPPGILWQLWNPPVPSMSDSIRKALRD